MERLRVMPALEGIPIIVVTALGREPRTRFAARRRGFGGLPEAVRLEAHVASVRSQLGEAGA